MESSEGQEAPIAVGNLDLDSPPKPPPKSKLSYMPRLDGLRGIAIGAVLIAHFVPNPMVAAFRPGGFGVILFFVLSGYLITRILMQYKDRSIPVGVAASHFYWRRFLRLSPPYYLAIVGAALFGIAQMREHWWIHVFYLSNIAIGFRGDVFGAGHFLDDSASKNSFICSGSWSSYCSLGVSYCPPSWLQWPWLRCFV